MAYTIIYPRDLSKRSPENNEWKECRTFIGVVLFFLTNKQAWAAYRADRFVLLET